MKDLGLPVAQRDIQASVLRTLAGLREPSGGRSSEGEEWEKGVGPQGWQEGRD